MAALQSAVAATVAFALLGLDTAGNPLLAVTVAIANAVLGMALGLFVSAFALTEFQAVQFMPAVVMPQALLCGLVAPRDEMVGWLGHRAAALPTAPLQALQVPQ